MVPALRDYHLLPHENRDLHKFVTLLFLPTGCCQHSTMHPTIYLLLALSASQTVLAVLSTPALQTSQRSTLSIRTDTLLDERQASCSVRWNYTFTNFYTSSDTQAVPPGCLPDRSLQPVHMVRPNNLRVPQRHGRAILQQRAHHVYGPGHQRGRDVRRTHVLRSDGRGRRGRGRWQQSQALGLCSGLQDLRRLLVYQVRRGVLWRRPVGVRFVPERESLRQVGHEDDVRQSREYERGGICCSSGPRWCVRWDGDRPQDR